MMKDFFKKYNKFFVPVVNKSKLARHLLELDYSVGDHKILALTPNGAIFEDKGRISQIFFTKDLMTEKLKYLERFLMIGAGLGVSMQTGFPLAFGVVRNYNCAAADATITCGPDSAAAVQDGTAAKSLDSSGTSLVASWNRSGAGTYTGKQPIMIFDTSAIPDGKTILTASLYFYISALSNIADNTYDYFVLDKDGTLTNPVTTANWDGRPINNISATKNITLLTASQYNNIDLDAGGVAYVSTTGDTIFRMCDGICDANAMNNISVGETLGCTFNSGNNASNKPYLKLTFNGGFVSTFML